MSSVLEPGYLVDGRYAVERELGRGAFGVVYRVRHLKLDTAYALKVLSVPSGAIRQRMLQEGRVQASLRHPNIVSVTDVVEVDGSPGLVMEYVDGDTLEALLQRRKLSWEQVDQLAEGVIAGVAEAHRRGFVHRDLKPANVLLATVGGDLVPKIADFGLAKIVSGEGGVTHTRSGMMMGTPAYMAPEQSKNAKGVDQRADVFALGAILYDLACGRRAFEGEDLVDVLTAVRREAYVPPRQVRPDVPARVERAIEGALRADPEQRFPDCGALLAALQGREASKKGLWGDLASGPTLAPSGAAGLQQPSDPTWGDVGSAPPGVSAMGPATAPIPATVQLDAALPEGSLAPRPAPSPTTTSSPVTSTSGGVAPYALAGTALAALAAVVLLAVVGIGGTAMYGGAPWSDAGSAVEASAPAPAAIAPAVAPEALPAAPVAPVADPAPEPSAEPPPASRPAGSSPVTKPATKPAPKAAEETASAAPAEPAASASVAAPTDAQVIVTGVDRVWLVSEAGRFSPGRVPPGTYEVQVFFDPARATPALSLTVAAGEVRTLQCAPDLKICR